MTGQIHAPWTPSQVDLLNRWQRDNRVHPFTCPNRGDASHRVGPEGSLNEGLLVPTVRGWICPHCDYVQDWAHDFMLQEPTDPMALMHSGDKALLEAAATGKGLMTLTPDRMHSIMDSLSARRADIDARYPALVEACPYETRLAVTAWVMKQIVEHAKEGGTYRYLIYHRLGFGPDAYVPLCGDGLTISNEFDLEKKPEPR